MNIARALRIHRPSLVASDSTVSLTLDLQATSPWPPKDQGYQCRLGRLYLRLSAYAKSGAIVDQLINPLPTHVLLSDCSKRTSW